MKTLARLSDITERSNTSHHRRAFESTALFGIGAMLLCWVGSHMAANCRLRERAHELTGFSRWLIWIVINTLAIVERTQQSFDGKQQRRGDVHLRDEIFFPDIHSLDSFITFTFRYQLT